MVVTLNKTKNKESLWNVTLVFGTSFSVGWCKTYLYSHPIQIQHGCRQQVCPTPAHALWSFRTAGYHMCTLIQVCYHYKCEQSCQRCKHWWWDAHRAVWVSRRLSIFRDTFWMLMTHTGKAATLLSVFVPPWMDDGWMVAGTCAELRYSGTLGKICLSFKKTCSFDINMGFLPHRWMCSKMGQFCFNYLG